MRPILPYALLLLVPLPCAGAEGKLERIREEASEPSDEKEDRKDRDCYCHDSCDDENEFLAQVGYLVVSSPFVVPSSILEGKHTTEGYFVSYPYVEDFPGALWVEHVGHPGYPAFEPECFPVRFWTARVSVETGSDFSGLDRVGGQVVLDTTSRWGMHSAWNYYHEELKCGCADETFLGDVNVTYRFAQSERARMYAGVGVRFLADRRDGEAGVNFLYGGDFFPARPLVFSCQVDGGTLGRAGVFHTRASLGVTLRRWEFFAGYDYLNIGGVSLQGPLVGIRGWF